MGRLLASADHGAYHFGRRHEPVHRDGSWLGAAVEARAAARAAFSGIGRRMHAILAQLRRQYQALGRARLHAQPAPFTFFDIDRDITAWLRRHVLLAIRQSPTDCAETSTVSRNTRITHSGTGDGQSG